MHTYVYNSRRPYSSDDRLADATSDDYLAPSVELLSWIVDDTYQS